MLFWPIRRLNLSCIFGLNTCNVWRYLCDFPRLSEHRPSFQSCSVDSSIVALFVSLFCVCVFSFFVTVPHVNKNVCNKKSCTNICEIGWFLEEILTKITLLWSCCVPGIEVAILFHVLLLFLWKWCIWFVT